MHPGCGIPQGAVCQGAVSPGCMLGSPGICVLESVLLIRSGECMLLHTSPPEAENPESMMEGGCLREVGRGV